MKKKVHDIRIDKKRSKMLRGKLLRDQKLEELL